MNPYTDVAEFHHKFGLEYEGKPRILPVTLSTFREGFMIEEALEYIQARTLVLTASMELNNKGLTQLALAKQLDALVDLTYVALGTAHLHGFDFNEAWRRVHQANMAKQRRASGTSSRGTTFDVIKPDGWKAPDLLDLVA